MAASAHIPDADEELPLAGDQHPTALNAFSRMPDNSTAAPVANRLHPPVGLGKLILLRLRPLKGKSGRAAAHHAPEAANGGPEFLGVFKTLACIVSV